MAALIRIIANRKSDNHSYFCLEKKQAFFKGFRKFLVDLGFEDEDSNFAIYSFGRPLSKSGDVIMEKEDSIASYVDNYYYFENEDFRVDVVFGKSRVFLMINSGKDMQQRISQKIQKFCTFYRKQQ